MMHRPDTKEKISALLEKIRKIIPDVVLRTTVIVGFPGETDQQFEELLDFVKQVRFDALGCFTFWPEEGTKAAELPNQISQKIKDHENSSDRQAAGRFYGQAPHIDSICLIEDCPEPPGIFVQAKITGFKDYDLIAEKI